MKAAKRMMCLVLAMMCLLSWFPATASAAYTEFPESFYLTQNANGTCTLCAATMMIRSVMYINGNEDWHAVTESGVRPTGWLSGSGLRWSFRYTLEGTSVQVGHEALSGISSAGLKALLDDHPEGIVLYCGKIPHAVFLLGYEGDTFYCADTPGGYSGKRITLEESWLGVKYGTQANILSRVTAYWYVSEYKDSGTSACGCQRQYAGTYTCATSTTGLRIRSGHGTSYSTLGVIPAGATVIVTRASGDGKGDWAHVVYNGISGYASMQYLQKVSGAHHYESTVLKPTCEAGGYTLHTCTECGHSYQSQQTSALGHAYGEWTASSEPGKEIRSCARCGDTQTRQTETGVMGTITGSNLRIRAGAGTSYSVVGYLQIGDLVEILEQKTVSGTNWGRIESGWISMDYVLLDSETDVPSQPQKVTGVIIGTDRLRVRSSASSSGSVVGYLYRGAAVEILEQKTVSGTAWGRTEDGWIMMRFVQLDETAEPEPEPEPEPELVRGTITGTDRLRVRSSASSSGSVVGYLYRGAAVEILEQKTVSGTVWGRTEDGWIMMDFVQLDETAEPEPEPEPITGTVSGTDRLRVRSSASASGSVVGYLYRGDTVEILEQKTVSDTVWGRTEDGWIMMDFIR